MKLNVLYAADGRILAVSKVSGRTDRDASGPVLRSGPEAQEGQRVTAVDIDLADRSLADLHRHFVVVDEGHGVRLKERATRK